MTDGGINPDVISFNTAISACANGGQWEKALNLLQELMNRGIEPDIICFNAAISACAE